MRIGRFPALILAVFCMAVCPGSIVAEPAQPPQQKKDAPRTITLDLPASDGSSVNVELRINEKGELLDKNKAALRTPAEVDKYLQALYTEAKQQAAKAKGKEPSITATLRGPRGDHLKPAILELKRLAAKVGFAAFRVVREPELPVEVTVLLKADKDGALERVEVKRTGQKPVSIPADKWEEALLKHLEGIRKDVRNQEEIQIEADSKLKYALMINVLDLCIKAGFDRVGFAPPPDLDNNKP